MNSLLKDSAIKTIFLGGLHASAASLFLSTIFKSSPVPVLFILNDLEEAGYFYHDLVQANGEKNILFFPSSYRRAIKYGQSDAASEILRTEVLNRLQNGDAIIIVTYPEALAEKVVSAQCMNERTLKLKVGMDFGVERLEEALFEHGFSLVDYVYEPGQYAVRGSIIDVYSFSSEYPYRIDFFGNEIDSIRSFEVETQLSKEKKDMVVIVPELAGKESGGSVSFLNYLPQQTIIACRDLFWVKERIHSVHEEVISPQAVHAYEGDKKDLVKIGKSLIDGPDFLEPALTFKRIEFGNKPIDVSDATLNFDVDPQPLYHKNFDMVSSSLADYMQRGYTIYICTDSQKQAARLKDIFEERGDRIVFQEVNKTLHGGFTDNQLKCCIFTDHQIFDRFHKYNLRSEKARNGKVALTLKELNEFEIGDYIVHIDHGIGKFGGLVRMPNGNSTQEVIKIIYQHDDVVFVSIHNLHKISKYKGKEGEEPRLGEDEGSHQA